MTSTKTSCNTCNGTGRFNSRLTGGVCPECRGRGYLERSVSETPFEQYKRQLAEGHIGKPDAYTEA